jgi:arylsulfatase A-like enzyme
MRVAHPLTTASLAAILICLGASVARAAPRRPNIVLVLADDLGYGDLRAYDSRSKIPTPHLDRLAAEGLRFLDAHTPSSVCTPTRYALLTGRYAWRTRLEKGVLGGTSPALLEPGRPTLASLLKESGYATAAIGKWHLGLGTAERVDYARPLVPGPNAAGFDEFFGIPASLDMEPYVFVQNTAPVEAPTATVGASELRRKGGAGFWRAGRIAPSFKHADVMPRLTDAAVAYIRRRDPRPRPDSRPFFLYLPLSAPHTPWLPTAEFVGKSGAGPYGDFVAQVDATVGKVVETIAQMGLRDQTLVIVTSDNGAHWLPSDIERWGHRANGALRGQKSDIHEGGHRVPFLLSWPGVIRPNTTTEQTLCLTDLVATLASITGTKLPADAAEDSFDLSAIWLGAKRRAPVRPSIVHHSGEGMFAIRAGRWKLVLGLGSGGFTQPKREEPAPGGPRGQLYDLVADPGETRNVWSAQPAVVRRLEALLAKQRREGHSRPGARRPAS